MPAGIDPRDIEAKGIRLATVIDPAGNPWVLIQSGDHRMLLTAEAAGLLAEALMIEAAYAAVASDELPGPTQ